MSRVLLADDHDLVRDTLAAYLRSEGGFDVAVAGKFDDALAMVRAQDRFDLVLLDYRMPGMAALAGLARMREQARCPVAILSGTAPPEVARRALRAGAAGFLPKTLAPRALIAAVRRILGGDTYAPCDFLTADRDPGAEADIALTARATVVSHAGGRVVLDAGSKVLGADRAAYATGFGRVLDKPKARIVSLSEHHAVVEWPGRRPRIGSQVDVVPNHVCAAVNLADVMWVEE
ncbi:MAG: response regulator, partial [Roseovarius sp.]